MVNMLQDTTNAWFRKLKPWQGTALRVLILVIVVGAVFGGIQIDRSARGNRINLQTSSSLHKNNSTSITPKTNTPSVSSTQTPTPPASSPTSSPQASTSAPAIQPTTTPSNTTYCNGAEGIGLSQIDSDKENEASTYASVNLHPTTETEMNGSNNVIRLINNALDASYAQYTTFLNAAGCPLLAPAPTHYPLITDPGNLPT
jgi:hypothetical protein